MKKKTGNQPLVPIQTIDFPRCGARSKRTGLPCLQPAIHGKKRCRLHGGKSTGPRTPEGLARSQQANWRHGFCSVGMKAERDDFRRLLRQASAMLREVRETSV